uniref:Uncharacterized protein AlNc14C161G7783 n=1 Tax=Albugo laibachii Nc14 TaxID=890382 RepID=F0WMU7_9STRA|nr:conserved hypothetical protein [Albugo laibachii Nc14]|eukprot:CCA22632.1 conserved hypothetical protein [Albugo laibachii Nc14]
MVSSMHSVKELAKKEEFDANFEPTAPSETVPIPQCASWFSMESINPIEQRMLPEFFQLATDPPHLSSAMHSRTSSKTPQLYMKYRNYMINAYRQEPHIYLTATACRRNLAGDACAILRVHEFLTHWGLINFSVPPHQSPLYQTSYQVHGKSASALQTEENASFSAALCEICGSGSVEYQLSAEAKTKIFSMIKSVDASAVNATDQVKLQVNRFYVSDSGNGVFCGKPGSGICEQCLTSRQFPDGLDTSDFIRVREPSTWTLEEQEKLMQAVNQTSNMQECDWNAVALTVKTKSPDECMLHFLQLPLMDQLTSTADVPQQECTKGFPEEELNEPVRSLTMLMSQADPFVTKRASQAAIQAIYELHELKQTELSLHDVKREESITDEAGSSSFQDAVLSVQLASEASGVASYRHDPSHPKDNDQKNEPFVKTTVSVAEEVSKATSIAMLAVRAETLASKRDESIDGLLFELYKNQMEQFELKFQQLQVLEKSLEIDKHELAQARYDLYTHRLESHQKAQTD